jgi:hypothetical protein
MARALRLFGPALGTVFVLAPNVASAQIANAVPVNERSTSINGTIPNICVMAQPRLAAGAQVNFLGLTGNARSVSQFELGSCLQLPAPVADRGAK